MKQNKTEPYQVFFLSKYDNVIKDKDRIKRDTLISGEMQLSYFICTDYKPGHIFPPASLFAVW
jgi:hypothetical protein